MNNVEKEIRTGTKNFEVPVLNNISKFILSLQKNSEYNSHQKTKSMNPYIMFYLSKQ